MSALQDEFVVHRAANGGRGWVVWLVTHWGDLTISNRVRWHETKGAAESHARRLDAGKGRPHWMGP